MSDTAAENDSESSLPVFRPFTREELAVIEHRIEEKKISAQKKAERNARNKAVRDKDLRYCLFSPSRDKTYQDLTFYRDQDKTSRYKYCFSENPALKQVENEMKPNGKKQQFIKRS